MTEEDQEKLVKGLRISPRTYAMIAKLAAKNRRKIAPEAEIICRDFIESNFPEIAREVDAENAEQPKKKRK